jgi:hypothetical protein
VPLARELGDEQVFVAIAIEVACIDAHASPFASPVSAERNTGEERRIREGAVVLVDPQLVRRAVVGDKDIDPAVAIEVSGRDTERRADSRPIPAATVTSVNVPSRLL